MLGNKIFEVKENQFRYKKQVYCFSRCVSLYRLQPLSSLDVDRPSTKTTHATEKQKRRTTCQTNMCDWVIGQELVRDMVKNKRRGGFDPT